MNVTRRTCPVCRPTSEQLEEHRRADLGLTAVEPLPDEPAPEVRARTGTPRGEGQQTLQLVQLGEGFTAGKEGEDGTEA